MTDTRSTGTDKGRIVGMDIKTVGKIAGVGALGVGAAFVIAGCGASEKTGHDTAFDVLGDFDKDGNGISVDEAAVTWQQNPVYGAKRTTYRVGDFQYWERNVGVREWTQSVRKAVSAADGLGGGVRDGLASWAELASLADKFNVDETPTLNRSERKAFDREYGEVRQNDHTTWTGVQTGYDIIDRYPNVPPSGPTAPGDDQGPTAPGDDPVFPFPGPGNGPGDDVLTPAPVPAPMPPAPTPPNNDSTGNGNPTEDQF